MGRRWQSWTLLLASFALAAAVRAQSDGGFDLAPTVTMDLAPTTSQEPAAASAKNPRARFLETGRRAYDKSKYSEALHLAREGEAAARAAGDDILRAECLSLMAVTLSQLSDFPEAIATFERARALAEANPSRPMQLGSLYINGATIYYHTADYDRALELDEKALALGQQQNQNRLICSANIGLGNIECTRRHFEPAMDAYLAALAAAEMVKGPVGLSARGDIKINIGIVFILEKKSAEAVEALRDAVAIHLQTGLQHHLAVAYRSLSRALRLAGDLDEALKQLRLGYEISKTIKSPRLSRLYALEFTALYEARGELRNAISSLRNANVYRETSMSENTRARMESLRERYDSIRRERDLALLQQKQALQDAELERATWQRVGLGASLVLVGVITLWIISRQRIRLRAKALFLAETLAAKQAAEEADRTKTRLLGIASHDIKSPLATVNHLVEDLRANQANAAELEPHLSLIQGQVRRVLSHARDFLDVAALESGQLKLVPAQVNLPALARAVVAEQQWHALTKGQNLIFEEPAVPVGEIEADASRLHQMLANLVDNAIKFSPAGATTTVSVKRVGERVHLAVRDEGPGLTTDDLVRLYTPFHRGSFRPTGNESSHGYGLSIVMELTRLHGGTLAAESRPEGGATFTLELPAPMRKPWTIGSAVY